MSAPATAGAATLRVRTLLAGLKVATRSTSGNYLGPAELSPSLAVLVSSSARRGVLETALDAGERRSLPPRAMDALSVLARDEGALLEPSPRARKVLIRWAP